MNIDGTLKINGKRYRFTTPGRDPRVATFGDGQWQSKELPPHLVSALTAVEAEFMEDPPVPTEIMTTDLGDVGEEIEEEEEG